MKTTESTQKTNEKTEQVKEAHQKEDNKAILNMQADSVIIEENHSESDLEPETNNCHSSNIQNSPRWTKRTIKVYGIHKNVKSHKTMESKEKIQVKKKGTIKTSAKTKEEKPSSNGTFIGIVIVLLCLLMIAGFVCWKIAVQ